MECTATWNKKKRVMCGGNGRHPPGDVHPPADNRAVDGAVGSRGVGKLEEESRDGVGNAVVTTRNDVVVR